MAREREKALVSIGAAVLRVGRLEDGPKPVVVTEVRPVSIHSASVHRLPRTIILAMKTILLLIQLLAIGAATPAGAQEPPKITYAASHYKTASGAIGPSGVIASQTYRIVVEGVEEMAIDRIVAGRRVLDCVAVATAGNGKKIELSVVISMFQTAESTAKIMSNDRRVGYCTVEDPGRYGSDRAKAALVMKLRSARVSYRVVRMSFDSETSQYNK